MNESRSISFEGAVAFELALGALAMLLGWLLGHDVLAKTFRGLPFLAENARAFLVGLLATVPLVLALLAIERWPPSWLGETKESVQQIMAPLLLDAGWAGRVSLALAAGIGEELLFRGLAQDGLEIYLGAPGAVFVGALIFGLCHAISLPYLIVASLIGVFLGTLYVVTGNLLAPVVCHAAYDVFAMQRLLPGKETDREEPSN